MTRTQMFLIFIPVVLLIYGLLNTYIFIRGMQAIPKTSPMRPWVIGFFFFFVLSFILARVLERYTQTWPVDALVWIGSFWLGAMAYFFVILLTIDILRCIDAVFPFFPAFITGNIILAKKITALSVTILVALILTGGRINSAFPIVKTLNITIHKKSPIKHLNVVLATDIHLGTIICNSHFMRIVSAINSCTPDIVLFAGDIVDENIEPVIRQNLGETLGLIKSKYGTYGITGNHEYIGGVEAACTYLEKHSVTMLRDSSVVIDKAFVLVGREDYSSSQINGKKRKSLEELMKNVDRSLPVILMDHQPRQLSEAVRSNVDLQLSGHTHNGQLWPFNFITRAVYDLSWGYLKIENTQFYVSCGVGTWGPPMRTGNRPEVVNIKFTFD
jgi:uncharacterized protein